MKNIYFLIRPSYQRIAFLVLCILMVTVPGVISAQSGKQQIKGQVLDGQGDALIGVAVRNLTTSTGVITDIDGFYAIEAQKGEILEFHFSESIDNKAFEDCYPYGYLPLLPPY